jgi:hypothetical protein
MNKKLSSSLAVLAVGGAMLVGSATAQNNSGAGPGVVDPGHPRVNQVNQREERQQQRIGNGVKNGTLTPKQTANLERREANLQKREQADMAKNNGHLTKGEQASLNRQENRISHSIATDKAKNQ